MYGGDDIEWVRKFTSLIRDVCGKGLQKGASPANHKDYRIREAEFLLARPSHGMVLLDPAFESMLFSKIQQDKADNHVDPVRQGIKRLLSYDKEGGWTVLSSKGSSIVVNGHGTTVVNVKDINPW